MEGILEPCDISAGLPVSAAQVLQQADVKRELPKPRLGAVQREGASADRVELAHRLALTVVALEKHCKDSFPDVPFSKKIRACFTKPLLR